MTVLGKYGPHPKAGGACSSYFLKCGGKKILVDCGSGSISRLQQTLPLENLDAILLSHLHYDHISDMFVLRYALEGLKTRGALSQAVPVYMPEAPANVAELIRSTPAFEVRPVTDGMEIELGRARVRFKAMTHPVPSFAMRFEDAGRVLVYSGDTTVNDAIVPFAAKADVLLMEAGLLERDKKERSPHVSALEAARIAREAGARRLIATHIHPGYDERDVAEELAREYPLAEIAQEGQTYII